MTVLLTALGGLDGLVFTAGIGQNSDWIRYQVCSRLAWLGIDLDVKLNKDNHSGRISTKQSEVTVWMLPTDEEETIASYTYKVVTERKIA